MLLLLPVWMLLFSVRHSLAVRDDSEPQSENVALITEGGQLNEFPGDKPQDRFPNCAEIAKSTYPGRCDPHASAFACYSLEKEYQPEKENIAVVVHWACSSGFNKEGISNKECSERPWHFLDTGMNLSFTAPAGIYAGACEFARLPEQKTQYTEFPDCLSVMETFPGGCNPKASAYACYNKKTMSSSEGPSYCSDMNNLLMINEENCQAKGYAGACQFEVLPPTAPKLDEPVTIEASQDLPSTAPTQAGPTTTKNAAAGGAAGFLLATCIGLVHLLHPTP